jgi:hypothetical protein
MMFVTRIRSAFLAALGVLLLCAQPAFAQIDGPAAKAALSGVTNGKVAVSKYTLAARLLAGVDKGYDPTVTVPVTVTETTQVSQLTGLDYDQGKFLNDPLYANPVGGGKSPTQTNRVRYNNGGYVFYTDAPSFEFYANTGRYEIYVNGQPASGNPYNTVTTGVQKKVDLGSAKQRRIEIRFNKATTTITGVAVRKPYSMWPAPVIGPLVLWQGDSITEGPPYGDLLNPGDGYAMQLGRMNNWNVVAMGVGGTGWLAGSPNDALPRVENIADYPNAALVGWAFGINDGAAVPADVTTAVKATLTRARVLQPNALFVVTGPWRGPGQAPSQAISDAIKAGFDAVKDDRMLFIDTYAENWQNGVGAGYGGLVRSGPLTFTSAPTAATSATLTAAWGGATGSYTVTFQTATGGVNKTATLTNGSTALSWTGAVTATVDAWAVNATGGNSDLYFVNDLIHPGVVGHTYMARRLSDDIVKWLRSIVAERGVVVGVNDNFALPASLVGANDNTPAAIRLAA